MIEALIALFVTSNTDAARKKELKAVAKDELKDLVVSKGLDAGNKTAMIEALLKQDAKAREEFLVYESTRHELESKKREHLSSKTNPELKELCGSKGLKIGGGKVDKVERLLQTARDEGDIDVLLIENAYDKRQAELDALEKPVLKSLCDKAGVDTFIKDVAVQRIVASEFDK